MKASAQGSMRAILPRCKGKTRLSTIWNDNNSTIQNELSNNDHNQNYQERPRPPVAAVAAASAAPTPAMMTIVLAITIFSCNDGTTAAADYGPVRIE